MPGLVLRAPFEAPAATTPDHYSFAIPSDDEFALTVAVDGTVPARLRLLPVFPGTVTFKPAAGVVIPPDPSAVGAAPIPGDLYLVLAAPAIKELVKEVPSFGYRLTMAYRGVTISRPFFIDTVLKGLQGPKGYPSSITIGGTDVRKPTEAQLTNAFAKGDLSVEVRPTKASAESTFPVLPAADSIGTVTIAMGALATHDPFAPPGALDLASRPADAVLVPPDFVPIPIPYWSATMRSAARWTSLAATGHASHPFFAALESFDIEQVPPERWRRIRAFLPGPRPKTQDPLKAFERLAVRAIDAVGSEIWAAEGNLLGEVFIRRPDGEDFFLSASASGTGVRVSLDADGVGGTDRLHLSWAPPAGGHPSVFEISGELDLTGDPLTIVPLVPLSEKAEDFRGLTIDRKKKVILAERELVVPLQRVLAGLGFGVARTPSPLFDVRARGAVREFQREARTTERMSAGAAVDPATVIPFTGTPTGAADAATLAEMLRWRTAGYRSLTSFFVRRNMVRINDVGFASPAVAGFQVFRDPTPRIGAVITSGSTKGIGNTGGLSLAAALNASGPGVAVFPGTRWEKRAVCAVVNNEAKVFEALNTWDDSFLSAGLFQWTLGNTSDPSELPGVCSTLPAADFARLFGKWGLSSADVTGALNASILRGRFRLDGTQLSQDVKEEFRSFRWAYRFFAACEDGAFRLGQYRNALSRLNVVLGIAINFGGTTIHASELLQSEMLRAMALDHHVNRPAHVGPALQACCDALRDPDRILAMKRAPVIEFLHESLGSWYEVGRIHGFTGSWYEELYDKEHGRRLKETRKRTKNPKATLSQDELDEIDADLKPIVEELVLLKVRCLPAGPADPIFDGLITDLGLDGPAAALTRAHTADLTVLGATLELMSQGQHDALAELYRFRRNHVGTMTDPEDRWTRIANGGYAGALGDPLTAPKVFTL